MKKLSAVLIAAALSTSGFAQGQPGSDSKNISVKPFTDLKVSGVYKVTLIQGSSESVKLEGDEKMISFISVKNEGSKLIIDMDKMKNQKIESKKTVNVYITFKDLKTIDVSVVGDVISKGNLKFGDIAISNQAVGNLSLDLTAKSVVLKNKAVGDINLKGSADNAELTNSGVGSLEAGKFIVQTMRVTNSGVGSVNVNAVKEISVKSSGIGSVKNHGAAPVKQAGKSVVI